MSFIKSLWSFTKAHPVGAAITFVVLFPLVFGGVALVVYRAAKSGVAKVSPDLAAKLPTK